jgi:hypothetical protein
MMFTHRRTESHLPYYLRRRDDQREKRCHPLMRHPKRARDFKRKRGLFAAVNEIISAIQRCETRQQSDLKGFLLRQYKERRAFAMFLDPVCE